MTVAPLAPTPAPAAPHARRRRQRRPAAAGGSLAAQLSVLAGQELEVVSLTAAASMAFGDFAPVRDISSYEGQAHLTGLYCFRGRHVPYRSVLHREALRIMDFGGEVEALCVFPFYVHPEPRTPGRAPDFLAKLTDGRLRVIDVRRRSHAEAATTQRELAPTREVCRQLRWDYRLFTEPDELVHTNVRWLSLYRRPPLDVERYRDTLLDACADGATIDELLESADVAALALPVLFHLLWRRELRIALDAPIRGDSVVFVDRRLADGAG